MFNTDVRLEYVRLQILRDNSRCNNNTRELNDIVLPNKELNLSQEKKLNLSTLRLQYYTADI